MSGFTGSAGTAVVTMKEALLWTDARYFLQAPQELDAQHWRLMKDRVPEAVSIEEYLKQQLDNDDATQLGATCVVGVDASLVPFSTYKVRQKRRARSDKVALAAKTTTK